MGGEGGGEGEEPGVAVRVAVTLNVLAVAVLVNAVWLVNMNSGWEWEYGSRRVFGGQEEGLEGIGKVGGCLEDFGGVKRYVQ